MKTWWARFSFVLLCFANLAQAARFSVKAEFEDQIAHPSEVIRFFVTVEGDESFDSEPPALASNADFSVSSRSESGSRSSRLEMTSKGPQFQTQVLKTYMYELEARRTGDLRLGPLTVRVNGKSYQTNIAKITVDANARGANGGRSQAQRPRSMQVPPDDLEEIDDIFSQLLRQGLGGRGQSLNGRGGGARTLPQNPDEAFFIQVEADKSEAYVGEQVTVSFYLYTTGLIRDLDTLKYPSLKGFWKEDIEIATHLNYQSEVVNGVAYKKALLASFALFPIKEGAAEIDSYKAKCTVIPADLMGSFGKAYTFTKASLPVKIRVKPLPVTQLPKDFIGAVGDFQMSARIDDRQPVQHQPFPLKIRFEGRGNAKLVELPAITLPPEFELYDTQKDAKFYPNGLSFKEFTLLVIPRQAGQFQIPALTASVFDPVSQTFKVRKTEALVISVLPGAITPDGAKQFNAAGAQSGKTKAGQAAEAYRPKRLVDDLSSERIDYDRLRLVNFAVLILTALSAAGVWIYFARKSVRPEHLRTRVERKLKLYSAACKSRDVKAMGVEALNVLSILLSALSGSRIQDRQLRKLMAALPPGLAAQLGTDFEAVVESAERFAFSPDSSSISEEKIKTFDIEFTAISRKLLNLTETSAS